MKVINCVTEPNDRIKVMPTWDENCQRVFNIEMIATKDEGIVSVNISVDTAKELVKELQEFVSNEEGN
ncbi:hypothetical protein [Bacillus cereus]